MATSSGLDGVVFAETAISHVDGDNGRLVVAGLDVEQLATTESFEQATGRVLAAGGETERIAEAYGDARVAAWKLVPQLGNALSAPDAMDALRAALAHLRSVGSLSNITLADDRADAIAAIGAAPVFVAAWSRLRDGKQPIAPEPSLGQAADYLRMTTGSADILAARALEAYLVTVTDHGMNASTFTARVVASTGSDLVSAVVAAIGALKGPLHGGAPGPVLDMLDAIGEPAKAEAWLEAEIAAGRRLMGMGHRIYRVRDPRAAVLERALEKLEAAGHQSGRLALARAVERAAEGVLARKHPERALKANVEFYTAVLLDAVGLPRTLFSPTFAAGRSVGWCAHVAEQRAHGRLIRPASRYVGKMPG